MALYYFEYVTIVVLPSSPTAADIVLPTLIIIKRNRAATLLGISSFSGTQLPSSPAEAIILCIATAALNSLLETNFFRHYATLHTLIARFEPYSYCETHLFRYYATLHKLIAHFDSSPTAAIYITHWASHFMVIVVFRAPQRLPHPAPCSSTAPVVTSMSPSLRPKRPVYYIAF